MLGRSVLLLSSHQLSLPRSMCKKVPIQPPEKDEKGHTGIRKRAFTAKDLFDQLVGRPSPKKLVDYSAPSKADSKDFSNAIKDEPNGRANPSQTPTVEPGVFFQPHTSDSSYSSSSRSSYRRFTCSIPKPLDLHLFTRVKTSKHYDQHVHSISRCPVFDTISELEVSLICSSSPLNQFEEWLQWTAEGKVWKFPIDNEQDWEEQQVPFHEHVFLKKHVDQRLLNCRPLATFMDLVCHGLAQNPHFTVEQKLEHLRWYASYFEDKIPAIEATVREEFRVSELEDKASTSS